MRTAIIGCGAMGNSMGAYLAKNGAPVDMIVPRAEYVDAMRRDGAKCIGAAEFAVPVNAYTIDDMEGFYDLIFLFTKQTANAELLPKVVPHLQETSMVCTLQNGVPEPTVAEFVGKERTIGGNAYWAATIVSHGVTDLTKPIEKFEYLFEIGEISGKATERIQKVAELLRHMGPVKITDSLMASRWGKLTINACMSGMSTVCGSPFGVIFSTPKSLACLSYIGREVKACCEADGYVLPLLLGKYRADSLGFDNKATYDESQKLFLEMFKGSDASKASMLQDIEKGKLTEISLINGYVCKTGDRLGIDTPFNDKVVEIVSRIEHGEIPYSMDNLDFFGPEMFEYLIV